MLGMDGYRWHDAVVVAIQLLLEEDDRGRLKLQAADNPFSEPPNAFEDVAQHRWVLRLGSQDLAEAALKMSAQRYIVQSIDIRDEIGNTVEHDEWFDWLLDRLRQGAIEAVTEFLHGPGEGLYIYGIELFDAETAGVVALALDGRAFLYGAAQRERLISTLASIFPTGQA